MASHVTFFLSSADATADFARALAGRLRTGDTILLQGPIGAGKTHFARSLIQSLLLAPEDVPSPTFTLVQVYHGKSGEIWHSDLYRLTHRDEAEELGLEEAFENAICLVEWPERLAPHLPAEALILALVPMDAEEQREARLSWSAPKWAERLTGLVHG